MDITKFNTADACEQGAWVTIKDFDDIDTDMQFKVLGIDSKRFKSQVNRFSKQNENKKMDMEKLEASSIRTLVAITVGWKNVEMDGKEIPFDDKTAEEIYTTSPHISNQVLSFAQERTNFL